MPKLTHFDDKGRSKMVDVTDKAVTDRVAEASATVSMSPGTFKLIMDRKLAKGDVLEVARLAGIMAAKKTHELIPLCHPLPISSVGLDFIPDEKAAKIEIRATVRVTAKTGVEMEALTAVSVAGLTVYDMCKAVDKAMVVSDIMLLSKSGGRSGRFVRKG